MIAKSIQFPEISELPRLNKSRDLPGSVHLPLMKLFCFGGHNKMSLNSFETFDPLSQSQWKTLPINEYIPRTYHMSGVSAYGKLVLFRKDSSSTDNVYILSEEGKLEQILSAEKSFPLWSCPILVQKEKTHVGDMALVFEQTEGKEWSIR